MQACHELTCKPSLTSDEDDEVLPPLLVMVFMLNWAKLLPPLGNDKLRVYDDKLQHVLSLVRVDML